MKFREGIKNAAKKTGDAIKKVGESPYTKAAGIGLSASGVALAVKRIHNEKKQHEERIEKLDKIEKKLDQVEKKIKKFSIVGGGNNRKTPSSIIDRAIKYTALTSPFNLGETRKASWENLVYELEKQGGKLGINYKIEDKNYDFIDAHYKGQTLVLFIKDSGPIKALDKVLDSYCNTFDEACYSSEYLHDSYGYIVSIFVVEGTLKSLIYNFIQDGIKINIIK